MALTQEQRLKKSHIAMMKHPETALYSGVMMMGMSDVTDDNITAYTDGVNKRYGRKFLEEVCKDDREVTGLVLHENLHIALRHMIHNRDLFVEDKDLANQAADYVVNDIIVNIKDKALLKLPEGGCYDHKYHNMNMREIYKLLKEDKEGGGGKGKGSGKGEPQDGGGGGYQFDEHDTEGDGEEMNADKMKEMDARVDRALREGALLAGRLGVDIPRHITEILETKVNWKEAFREWCVAQTKGKDEYTWRRFNRRLIPNDIYMPSVEDETVGEIVIAIDTSGSIGEKELNEFATEFVSICDSVTPEMVRILWWDTMVHGEQKFSGDYSGVAKMLKPKGGGGTRVGCVAKYIKDKKINAQCVVVFTDGYLESDIVWDIEAPTLWMVTQNKSWEPPSGKKVFISN